jgi:hypothetical protein
MQYTINKACKLNAGEKEFIQNFGAEIDMSTCTKVHAGCSKSRFAKKTMVTPFCYEL